MSLSDFPLTGYKMTIVETNTVDLRERTFEPVEPSASRSPHITIALAVSTAVGVAQQYYRNLSTCGPPVPGVSTDPVSAPATGDSSFACADSTDGRAIHVMYVAYGLGNVVVAVNLQPAPSMNLSSALDQAVMLARQQLTIVMQKAPPN